MTDVSPSERESDIEGRAAPSQRRQARSPARRLTIPPRTEPRRFSRRIRRVAFASTLVLLFASVPILAFIGANAVFEQDSAATSLDIADPDAPGYEALVTPTETLLLIQENELGAVVAFSLIAANPQGGGSVLLIPTALRLSTHGGTVDTLAEIHQRDGALGAAAVLSAQFRVGFGSTVVVDDAAWQNAVAPAAPLEIDNPNEVLRQAPGGLGGEADEEPTVAFEIGQLDVDATEVGAYLSLRNPSEDERALLFRQSLLWSSWTASLAAGSEVGGTGEFSAAMRSLGKGPVALRETPVEPVESLQGGEDDPEFDLIDDEAVRLLSELVPFPTGGAPGDRTKIRLLNGIANEGSALTAIGLLVPAGAEITVLGNDLVFDRSETVVLYRDPAQLEIAADFVDALGTGRVEFDSRPPTGSVDITVIIGQDFELQAK